MRKFIVITTINEKTKAICDFQDMEEWHLVVVGDMKSKPIDDGPGLTFLSIDEQKKLGFASAEYLPFNHYTRKNIGYLYAIRDGADVIYDTDDDNLPYDYWAMEPFECSNQIDGEGLYLNVYSHFTDKYVWPRGFPLDLINKNDKLKLTNVNAAKVGVWQGLADLDPDVDAIYRLIFNQPVTFDQKEPVVLPKGKFCPFNSQNTFWRKEAFPFLYLPATTSFRFTDILRGFIAQRLLWVSGMHLGFHGSTVYQERNAHDFMRDFSDEIECYLNVRKVVDALQDVVYDADPVNGIQQAYHLLQNHGLMKSEELPILDAWCSDLSMIL